MSKRKNPPPLFSEDISGFLNSVTKAIKDYDWNMEQLEKLDKLTQDYLHKLELGDLSYKEKCKISVQLSRVRKQRREHKDSIEILKPIVTFMKTEKGRMFKNNLSETLGQTRKAENKLGDRIYWFRILSELPIVEGK